MLARRIASRYAEALIGLAQQQGATAQWEQELAMLAGVIAQSPDLQEVLTHPEIPLAKKEAVVQQVFAGKVSRDILSLLLLLLKRGHEPDMATIHDVFVKLWNAARQVLPVTITSALPLQPAQVQALTETITRRTGKTIQLTQQVDPDLISGLVVTMGDRVIDASGRGVLADLQGTLAGK